VMSGCALIVFSPFLVILLFMVRLESEGGGLFWQERIGKNGKVFQMVKFRTMVKNAAQIGPYFTQPGDTRVTRVGRFLRWTSLDELPQLWNVLKGDMSLVGPRPDVLEQSELYSKDEWQTRHRVQPGVTGLAQALFRSQATPEQRKSLDLEYVRARTMWLDMKILFWTVRQVFSKGGH